MFDTIINVCMQCVNMCMYVVWSQVYVCMLNVCMYVCMSVCGICMFDTIINVCMKCANMYVCKWMYVCTFTVSSISFFPSAKVSWVRYTAALSCMTYEWSNYVLMNVYVCMDWCWYVCMYVCMYVCKLVRTKLQHHLLHLHSDIGGGQLSIRKP